jgi:sorting nexin-1/2
MRKSTTRLLQLKTSRRITHISLSTKKKISIRQPMRVKLSHNLPPQTNSDSTMTKITLPTSTSLLNSSHLSNIFTLLYLYSDTYQGYQQQQPSNARSNLYNEEPVEIA